MNQQITLIQGIQALFLNATCVVKYPTTSPDTSGGETMTWHVRYSGLKCRIAPVSANYTAQLLAAGIKDQITSIFTCEVGKQVDIGDRIEWNGHTYKVVSNASQGSIETAVRRYISEVI